jgi:hypothetical protein
VPALRKVLSRLAHIGYDDKQIREYLGLADLADLRWQSIPIYRGDQLAIRDVLAIAIDLFLLQGGIPGAELDQLFLKSDQDVLVRAGLLQVDAAGEARARASLFPVGDRLIFADHAWPLLPHPGCTSISDNQVMSIGTDSRWLARATVRRSVGAALDLCTGSGIQALLAAYHSKRVVAVDISPRAAQCARFNSSASGASNIEVLVGDLYEPVGNQRFDLITANPPFVPSPRDSLKFREGGRSGEEVQRRIIAGLPHHLAPGGMAHIVTELGERGDESLSDRLREWLGEAPMDIYILCLRVHSAANYAVGHADGVGSAESFFNSVHHWAENLRAQGYTRMVSVLLTFQWHDATTGPPWTRSDSPQSLHSAAGTEVSAALAAEHLVRQPGFNDLLVRSRVRRAGPIALQETRVLGYDLPANDQAELLGRSLPIQHRLDSTERVVLSLIEKPMAFSELLRLTRSLDLDQAGVVTAISSLIRRGLVML